MNNSIKRKHDNIQLMSRLYVEHLKNGKTKTIMVKGKKL